MIHITLHQDLDSNHRRIRMVSYQLELQSNLQELLTEDTALLSEVIEEFVTLLGNSNRMHDLHEYTSKEIENDWGRG